MEAGVQMQITPSLKRTEIYRKKKLEDETTGGLISPVLIQYHFDGKPQAIDVLPHGNSKNSIPIHTSDKSLLEKSSSANI